MKRVLPCLLFLALLCSAALADPLLLVEDDADTVVTPYDASSPDSAAYTYSYRYPHADESDPYAYLVNEFYAYQISDALGFGVPIMADYLSASGQPASTDITYAVTCNNGDYFSVLVRTEEDMEGIHLLSYAGHVFPRTDAKAGSTLTLPKLLSLLTSEENDTWLEDRQTAKADELVRDLVWDQIEDNPDNHSFYDEFDRGALDGSFFPEEDFYLDESGNPVFFLQPGSAAPEGEGLLIFPIPLEDILDEL